MVLLRNEIMRNRYQDKISTCNVIYVYYGTLPYTKLHTWYKMVTANFVKFSSVSCRIFPLIRVSQVPRHSTLKACILGFNLDTIKGIQRYPLSLSLFEWFEQPSTAQKFTISDNFKMTFKSVLKHILFALILVLQFAKSCNVTTLLKWVYVTSKNPSTHQ